MSSQPTQWTPVTDTNPTQWSPVAKNVGAWNSNETQTSNAYPYDSASHTYDSSVDTYDGVTSLLVNSEVEPTKWTPV